MLPLRLVLDTNIIVPAALKANGLHPKFWKQTKVISAREFITLVSPHLVS